MNSNIKNYFKLQELVCKHVYNKYGERAWMFIDDKLIETLIVIREQILGVPMTANTWMNGGRFSQRGLRCNCCQVLQDKDTPYLSSHVLGKGIDFDAKGMTAQEVRDKIKENKHLLPYPIRLESDVNWVHLDVYNTNIGTKISYFKP